MKRLRSLLFIPALSSDKFAKALDRGADALIIDLEDAIAPDRKEEARPAATAAVRLLAGKGTPILVRLNSPPAMWRADIACLPEGLVDAVMLPKVESRAEVEALASALAAQSATPPAIVPLIETPRGLLQAADVAAHPAVVALGFGAGDYATALGVAPTPVAVTGPAWHVIACAHAWGRQCLGLAASIGEVGDLATFTQHVDTARAMGFTGTVCIHPKQVPIVNRGFAPSAAEIDRAERLLAADAQARAAGQGAFLFEGSLVDWPVVVQARALLAAQARD